MSTFLTIMIICGLLVGTSLLTRSVTEKETLRDFRNTLLTAKREGKLVSVVVDGIKLSINPKDLKIEVLSD